MRTIASAILFAFVALWAPLAASAQGTRPTGSGIGTITVRLSNFAFDPEHLRLKANDRFGCGS